ncbi:MAG: hypothetical protein ABEJ35_05925 [Halobacteriaceae archaeon]
MDAIQLWTDSDPPERVASGELRATTGDTITLAVDSYQADSIAGGEYRAVTLPASPRPEHEFGRLLRAADETMAAVQVLPGSDLEGLPVGALRPPVIAVRPRGGGVTVVPSRRHTLTSEETVYIVATPSVIRRVEAAATAAGNEGS